MRIYNRYILLLATAAGVVNAGLAFGGQKNLDAYITANIIVYLGITLLYVYLNPRARKALDVIGYTLFSGLMVVLVIKVMGILSGE